MVARKCYSYHLMMRRSTGIGFLCGFILFLTGCIKEDRDHCREDYPYMLSFIYYGNGATDIFPLRMETVHVYLFDMDGAFVGRYIRTKSQLQEFQGVPLEVQPGTYEAICWGNMTALSEITDEGEDVENHFLYSSAYLRNQPIVNFDSLYYGRETFTVPVDRDGNDTVYFHSAHIRMEVYVRGLASTVSASVRAVNDPEGWLQVRNVYVGYNFDGQVTGETDDIYPAWTADAETDTLSAVFDLFRFKNQNAIVIDIYNGTGNRVYSLDLTTFLAVNNIDVESVDELTVPVYIRFAGTNVYVSVKEWDSEDVDPIT